MRYYLTYIEADGIHKFKGSKLKINPAPGMCLVLGRNLDMDGATSNGAGKTGVFNILSWVLMGKIPGKGSEIIEVGGDGKGYATVELTSDDSKVRLLITRKVSGNQGELSVVVNDIPVETSGEGVRKPQLQLNTLLGLPDSSIQSFQAFLNTIYLTFDFVRGFADVETTASDRIDLLTKYLNLDALDVVLDGLRKERKILNDSVETDRRAVEEIVLQLQGKDVTLSEKNRVEQESQTFQATLDVVSKELDSLPNIEQILQQELDLKGKLSVIEKREKFELQPLRNSRINIQGQLATLGSANELIQRQAALDLQLSSLSTDTERLNTVLEDIRKLQFYVTSHTTTRNKLNSDLIVARREQFTNCPHCQNPVIIAGVALQKFSIENHEAHLTSLQKEIGDLTKLIEDSQKSLEPLFKEQQTLQSRQAEIVAVRREIEACKSSLQSIETLTAQLDDVNVRGSTLNQELKQLRGDLEEQIVALRESCDIEDVKIKRIRLTQDSNALTAQIQGNSRMIARFQAQLDNFVVLEKRKATVEGEIGGSLSNLKVMDDAISAIPHFRVYELEQAIPELERLTNEHLTGLQSDYKVKFPLNVNKSRTEFPIIITDELGQDRPFGTFSNGERQRISLACAFAQRNLAQNAGGFLLNCLLLDEVFDGLDDGGRDALIRYMATWQDQCFIITHGSVNDMIPQAIRVTRENGVSTFAKV